ncbi:MAG: hypothetical protein A3K83_07785 [Omnitrophica WOR_2 bacterium RBG_13_44_8b]|nr:MAG: hypothetical protein A3K83_07785 [Omnitrophica WOR_2 bacterium RBG_13_44_8b]
MTERGEPTQARYARRSRRIPVGLPTIYFRSPPKKVRNMLFSALTPAFGRGLAPENSQEKLATLAVLTSQ